MVHIILQNYEIFEYYKNNFFCTFCTAFYPRLTEG
jgi:hypothetical protein